jgi:hypothetical protein
VTPAGEQLRAAAEHLHPDLQAEVLRLLAAEGVLTAELRDLRAENAHLERRFHEASVITGNLRERNVWLSNRHADLAPEQFATAKRDALFYGTGFVKITSRGGARYETERIDPRRVVVRDA